MNSGPRSVVRVVLFSVALQLACGTAPGTAAPEAEPASSPVDGFVLPGADSFPPELHQSLVAALAARGEHYEPRTHHLLPDGSPRYVNRLILESSPYLLQHAHNPVNWYPWGDEAFEAARRLGRPVLLSIGYSTCHWCHVMEEESFEDKEIAAYLNANYIAIKVDREERPDLDAIYMTAVQMLTGRGGWPMTTWLTPQREPFFGGTYFPARDGDRGSRRGFLTLLGDLKQLYDAQPDRVAQSAQELTARIQRSMTAPPSGDALPGAESIDAAVRRYASGFDARHGGLDRAPKFPSSLSVRLLLRHHARTGDPESLRMADLTLTRMAAGGIYDQVGGGFHRYATDKRWLVPHFEKMLYDNALLAVAYVEAFQLTGRASFARTAREILDYVAREMTSPEGGFYSATDADSLTPGGEREEGWFFTWTPAEIRAVLGAQDARILEAYYNVTAGGNFEGRNILHVTRTEEEVAAGMDLAAPALRASLDGSREALYRARLQRPAPLRDDKILTAWNGLMISAFARAGFVLDEPGYLGQAGRTAEFLLARLRSEGRLLRSTMNGQARHQAYLDDYAFFIAALLDLYETRAELRWLREAVALQGVLDATYGDREGGGYFMTGDDHEALLAREKPAHDGAEPSGNSVALMNLLRLYELTSDDAYRVTADRLLRAFGPSLSQRPTGLPVMLLALDFRSAEPKEIVLVTDKTTDGADPFLDVLRRTFLPGKVLVTVVEGDSLDRHAELVPLVQGKTARKGRTTAYVCQGGVCQLPTRDVEVFERQLTAGTNPKS